MNWHLCSFRVLLWNDQEPVCVYIDGVGEMLGHAAIDEATLLCVDWIAMYRHRFLNGVRHDLKGSFQYWKVPSEWAMWRWT
jgi:hypothetical protein